jgi:hypothetical protein
MGMSFAEESYQSSQFQCYCCLDAKTVFDSLVVVVSLPREWFQEIKRMMMVHSTHGLFLACTQESCLYLHNIQLFNIHTIYKPFY